MGASVTSRTGLSAVFGMSEVVIGENGELHSVRRIVTIETEYRLFRSGQIGVKDIFCGTVDACCSATCEMARKTDVILPILIH